LVVSFSISPHLHYQNIRYSDLCQDLIKIEASKFLLPLAIDIEIAYRINTYYAIYVGMARIYETKMITADRKLTDTMSKTNLKKYVTWLGSHKW